MNESLICLKTVYDLRVNASDEPIRYHIPAYQRGYRWTPTQVTQLLDDIREFTKRENPQPEEFYCLQPLVLRRSEGNTYEVVDGQQRLTTLLLILRYFNERLTEKYRQKVYRLEYETRSDLYGFLDSPSLEKAASNIDFFHVDQATKTVSEWFERKDSEVEVIKDAFFNRAKVIWFELSPEENAVAAFTRLNVGKIPLTNGELIRALFLKRGKGGPPGPQQLQIAHEWDAMEKSFQSSDFWGFLSNDTKSRSSRIDFIFNLLIFPKYMTTVCTLLRYISIGLIGDDWHGEEAVGRSNEEATARRTHVADGQAPRGSGVGGGRGAPDGVHMEAAAR